MSASRFATSKKSGATKGILVIAVSMVAALALSVMGIVPALSGARKHQYDI